MKRFQTFSLTLLASLVLHGLIAGILLYMPPPAPSELSSKTVEFVIQEGENKQIYFTPDEEKPQDPIEELKEKVRLLSKTTKRFKKEMVARNAGKTQNRSPQVPKSFEPVTKPEGAGEQKSQAKERGRQIHIGDSSIAQLIPGVEQGGYTALNADQFLHYTFYSRVNQQIVNRWVQNIRNYLQLNQIRGTLPATKRKNFVTQVDVVLDSEGNYLKTIIERTSGVEELDQAAVRPFSDAAPFNNVPEEILDDDGNLHLRYRFYLLFDPRRLARGL